MYWQEDDDRLTPKVSDDVVDLVFAIACKALPVDHAYSLSQAIRQILPWLADEEGGRNRQRLDTAQRIRCGVIPFAPDQVAGQVTQT